MEIILAKNIGFCFGVRRAYDKSLVALRDKDRFCQMLGQLVHNESVVEKLKERGMQFITSADEARNGIVIIRAHGAGKEVFNILKQKEVEIIDATCPLVTKVQNAVRKMEEEGREIVIIGDKGHVEVESIKGCLSSSVTVMENEKDLSEVMRRLSGQSIGVVAQTTQDIENVKKCMKSLKKKIDDVKYEDTLCPAVQERQREVRELSEKVDLVLVIGAKNSANTQRLVEIVEEKDKKVFNIGSKDEVSKKWFHGIGKVGVISGTSAPDWIIEEIVEEIKRLTHE